MSDECSPFTIGVFIFVLAGVDARSAAAGPAPNCLKAYSGDGVHSTRTREYSGKLYSL